MIVAAPQYALDKALQAVLELDDEMITQFYLIRGQSTLKYQSSDCNQRKVIFS